VHLSILFVYGFFHKMAVERHEIMQDQARAWKRQSSYIRTKIFIEDLEVKGVLVCWFYMWQLFLKIGFIFQKNALKYWCVGFSG
jgi:hypothetical protein